MVLYVVKLCSLSWIKSTTTILQESWKSRHWYMAIWALQKLFWPTLVNVEISIRDYHCNAGISSWSCRKLRSSTCSILRDIWIGFRPSSIIFTMAFKLSTGQFRTMILYDWKDGLNCKESRARLISALGRPSTFGPKGSQLVPRIWAWELECPRCPSIKLISNWSGRRNDRCCSIIDWRRSTYDMLLDRVVLGDHFGSNIFNCSWSSQITESLRSTSLVSAHKQSKTNANPVLPKISGKIWWSMISARFWHHYWWRIMVLS